MKPLAALFTATIFLAACTSNQATVHTATVVDETQAAPAVHSAASAPTPHLNLEQASNKPAATAAAPSPAAVIRPNPLRPPMPPIVPGKAPIIVLCSPTPIGMQPQPINLLASIKICGSGFAAFEVVTLTFTSRFGTSSWTVVAGAAGTFQSGLAPAACRTLPGTVVAKGNRGHVSNILPLPALACRPGL